MYVGTQSFKHLLHPISTVATLTRNTHQTFIVPNVSAIVEGRQEVVERFSDDGNEDSVLGQKASHVFFLKDDMVSQHVVVRETRW